MKNKIILTILVVLLFVFAGCQSADKVTGKGFSAGFARADITPTLLPVSLTSSTKANSVHDNLYATCVAISDGDEVALLIQLDLKRMNETVWKETTRRIEKETGISADHVFLTVTHTHNSPEVNLTTSDGFNRTWLENVYYVGVIGMVKEACKDLSPTEVYGGTADTTGFAFVRRYICKDGSFDGINYDYPTGSPVVRHETDADPELQVLHLKRAAADKKDIVMVNWQGHAAHAWSTYAKQLSSDFVGILREGVEKDMDVHFAYYNGASGNLNFDTPFTELVGYQGYGWQDAGYALVNKVKEAIDSAEKLETGEIKVATGKVDATVRVDDPTRVAQAQECMKYGGTQRQTLLAKYKFQSYYEAMWMANRAKAVNATDAIPLFAITCGDLAFAGAPYEMFDTNGMEIKEGSSCKMTFVCGYTNGSYGYIPSAVAFSNGGYEVHCTRYVQGTAEVCVSEILNLIKNAQ